MAKKTNYVLPLQEETAKEVTAIFNKYFVAAGPVPEGQTQPTLTASQIAFQNGPVGKALKPIAQSKENPANQTIDYKVAFDILRFGKDSSNPYFPKAKEGETLSAEAEAAFNEQYTAAQTLLASQINGNIQEIANLPGQVVTAQKAFIQKSISDAREASVKETSAKLAEIQKTGLEKTTRIGTLGTQISQIKDQLKDVSQLSLPQQQELQEKLTALTQERDQLVVDVQQLRGESKQAKAEKEDAITAQDKSGKQLEKQFKKAEKRERQETKMSLRERISTATKDFFAGISRGITVARAEKEFEAPKVLSKEETQAKHEEVTQETATELTEVASQVTLAPEEKGQTGEEATPVEVTPSDPTAPAEGAEILINPAPSTEEMQAAAAQLDPTKIAQQVPPAGPTPQDPVDAQVQE